MKVIHLLRKPCSESTVAANVLKFGTGAMNIDGCRIDSGGIHGSAESAGQGKGYKDTQKYGIYSKGIGGVVEPPHPGGRWPANLVLQHLPTCEQTGTREEAGYTVNRFTDGAKPFGGGAGHPYESEQVPSSTVPVWACGAGCPVAGLDAQSGERAGMGQRVLRRGATTGTSIGGHEAYGNSAPQDVMTGYSDTGGASRYFKQLSGKLTGEE